MSCNLSKAKFKSAHYMNYIFDFFFFCFVPGWTRTDWRSDLQRLLKSDLLSIRTTVKRSISYHNCHEETHCIHILPRNLPLNANYASLISINLNLEAPTDWKSPNIADQAYANTRQYNYKQNNRRICKHVGVHETLLARKWLQGCLKWASSLT